jgi:hypothetical protein
MLVKINTQLFPQKKIGPKLKGFSEIKKLPKEDNRSTGEKLANLVTRVTR